MKALHKTAIGVALLALVPLPASAQSQAERDVVEQTRDQVETPPWPAGDQRGMGNTMGREPGPGAPST
jgi:hypothetical protein